jgi:hypothetical protein
VAEFGAKAKPIAGRQKSCGNCRCAPANYKTCPFRNSKRNRRRQFRRGREGNPFYCRVGLCAGFSRKLRCRFDRKLGRGHDRSRLARDLYRAAVFDSSATRCRDRCGHRRDALCWDGRAEGACPTALGRRLNLAHVITRKPLREPERNMLQRRILKSHNCNRFFHILSESEYSLRRHIVIWGCGWWDGEHAGS